MPDSFDAFYGGTAAIGASISLLGVLLLPVILDRDAFKKLMGVFTTAWFLDIGAQSLCTATLPAMISMISLAQLHSCGILSTFVQADVDITQLSLGLGFLSGAVFSFSPYTLHRMMPFLRLFGIFGGVVMIELGSKALARGCGAESMRLLVAFSLYNSFWLASYSALFALGLKSKRINTVKGDLRTIRAHAKLYERVNLPLPAVGSRYDGLIPISNDVPPDKRPDFVRGFFNLFELDYSRLRRAAANYAKCAGFTVFVGCFFATLFYAVRPSDGPDPALRAILVSCAFASLITYGYVKRTMMARRWMKAVVTAAS